VKAVLWCLCHDGDRAEWSASQHTIQTGAFVFAAELKHFTVGVGFAVAEASSSRGHDATSFLRVHIGVTAVQVTMWVATVLRVASFPELSRALLAATARSGDSADAERTGFGCWRAGSAFFLTVLRNHFQHSVRRCVRG